MHQFFSEVPLKPGTIYQFSKSQAHHVGNVLHMDGDRIRLVYEGKGYFATVRAEKGALSALVEEEDPAVNELDLSITLCMALIRREKMELVLQKLTELGVKRIVPFESSRCVVHAKNDKKERWNAIVQEASEQCKRNFIPEITPVVSFDALKDYRSQCNGAAYEKAGSKALTITDLLDQNGGKSLSIVIGPEGGFSDQEINALEAEGFTSLTLGNRILRAETAAMYCASAAGEWSMCRR